MKNLNILLLSLLFLGNTYAQDFEGTITYSITYNQLPAEMQGMEQMLPKSQKIMIKGGKTRFEQVSDASNTIVISDMEGGVSTILIEAMGQKFKLVLSKEDVDKSIEEQGIPEITYLEGTREIAGYTCKKAEVAMAGLDETAIFYYTEEIPPIRMRGMESLNLKGLPMEYEVSTSGMKMVVSVTEMELATLSDDMFNIPEGYMEMPDQMKQLMGLY
jgi:hypothetical protein